MPSQCIVEACAEAAVASLDKRPLCRQHFLREAYERLESVAEQMEQSNFRSRSGDQAGVFLEQCMREVANIACSVELPSNLERAQLLDILLWASEICGQLRRGPRVSASIPILVRSANGQSPWEEKTETRQLSAHGFSFACGHELRVGDLLTCIRLDNGRRAGARVAWARVGESGETEAGVEFVSDIDFWGVDVAAAKPVVPAKTG